jgi:hypothetical protein
MNLRPEHAPQHDASDREKALSPQLSAFRKIMTTAATLPADSFSDFIAVR